MELSSRGMIRRIAASLSAALLVALLWSSPALAADTASPSAAPDEPAHPAAQAEVASQLPAGDADALREDAAPPADPPAATAPEMPLTEGDLQQAGSASQEAAESLPPEPDAPAASAANGSDPAGEASAAKGGSMSAASSDGEAPAAPAPAPATGKGDLAEGRYYIVSALGAGKVLDVKAGSTANGGNVQIYSANGTGAQQWVLEVGSDGYAVIRNVKSGKVLDVSAARNRNGQNVQQWGANGTLAQKWIVSAFQGRFAILSALGGNFALDVAAGRSADGTNVQIYQRNNTNAQLFSFVSTEPSRAEPGERVLSDGVYTLQPAVSSSRVVGIEGSSASSGADARLYTDSASNGQAFALAWDGAGFYTITNLNSGLKLAPRAACPVSGLNVAQYNLGDVDLAKWKAVPSAGGGYSFISKAVSLALDIAAGKDADSANVQCYASNGTKAQSYKLTSLSSLGEGIASLIPMVNAKLVLDVPGASESAGASVQTYAGNSSSAQKFRVARQGAGYTLQPLCSGLYLTGSADGTLAQQKARGSWSGQVWLSETSGGNLVLRNADTGLVLDVRGASAASGARIQTYRANGTKAQGFLVRTVDPLSDGLYNIALSANTRKVASIQDGSRKNFANVRVLGSNGYNAQKFTISSLGNGEYTIRNAVTGRAMGVANASRASGANVDMYTYEGSASQKWRVRVNDDCTLTFVNVNSGKVLDVAGGKVNDGANIQVYDGNGTAAQRFRLKATSLNFGEVVRLGVPCYMQNPELPTGCEAVALTNALRYWGFNLGKTTIANRMPKGSDGVYNFIGNPYDNSGWIICAPGITNTANSYLKGKNTTVKARNITGTSLEGLRAHLDKGNPVVVWTTIGMGQPVGLTYRHGYRLRGNNHAVVLTGYNPGNGKYQVADSLAGTVWRDGGAFKSLYNAMGKQAVVLEG